jgi:hypothetical protein
MKHSLLDFSQKCLLNVDHEHFSFVDSKKEAISIHSTYSEEWVERYLTKKYYESDYGLIRNLFLPYAWGTNISKDTTPLQKQIFKEAEDFRIFKGITIPFFSKESNAAISLSFNKGEKLPRHKILELDAQLRLPCQLIITYKDLLDRGDEGQETTLKLINELALWQKDHEKQRKKHASAIMEILSDIRAAQMFISHHETKDLGLKTLHRVFKDIERIG